MRMVQVLVETFLLVPMESKVLVSLQLLMLYLGFVYVTSKVIILVANFKE